MPALRSVSVPALRAVSVPALRTVSVLAGAVVVVAATMNAPATASGGPSGSAPSQAASRTRPMPARVRLDQLGYLPGETKQARLMVARPLRHAAAFSIVDAHGRVVLRHRVPSSPVGGWNSNYRAVYRLSFSGLTAPGRYRLRVRGGVRASSPPFRVEGAGRLYGELVRYGVRFDQVQRDGRDVIPGPLHRRPSHLLDRHASVYAWPRMAPGSDLILDKTLTRIGGPVDVAGGWFDAGDYLKFTHSTAYNDVLLFTSARMLGRRSPAILNAEARHGLAWLRKMWDASSKTLYFQVGIGSGNRQGTFRGDHDGWRLPQADDRDRARIDRFVSHRPVFEAAAPGRPISPNLVGRVSAAFALAAQLDARNRPSRARRELRTAKVLYARADTASPPKPLVTALPHAFYPESSWRDDMELGGAEIALASLRLGRPARPFVRAAAHWARGYIHAGSGDTLNLYDTARSPMPTSFARCRAPVSAPAWPSLVPTFWPTCVASSTRVSYGRGRTRSLPEACTTASMSTRTPSDSSPPPPCTTGSPTARRSTSSRPTSGPGCWAGTPGE